MSPFGVFYVCAVAAFLPGILSQKKAAMSRHQLELKEHYEHLALIAEFHCDLPQPRLIPVEDLFSDYQTRGKAFFPEVTVLHKCDRNVGSCESGHRCGPIHANSVRLPFKVTYLEDMGKHRKGEWEMEYHSLDNHTSCGCLHYNASIEPPKTVVHVHYIDPSLMPPQNSLPLDNSNRDVSENKTSYDVPLYQSKVNETSRPLGNESVEEVSSQTPEIEEEAVRPNLVEGNGESVPSTNEVRESSSNPEELSEEDKESTTLTSDLIRVGDSSYDDLLKRFS